VHASGLNSRKAVRVFDKHALYMQIEVVASGIDFKRASAAAKLEGHKAIVQLVTERIQKYRHKKNFAANPKLKMLAMKQLTENPQFRFLKPVQRGTVKMENSVMVRGVIVQS
jgi:hypothetical protein